MPVTAKLDRLRAAYARAVERRKRADELATQATMRLSDAEGAESRARARLKRAEHMVHVTGPAPQYDAECPECLAVARAKAGQP